MPQIIKRAILINFHPSTYTADVLIPEATATQLLGIPIATHVDGTSAQAGALCAVLLFDEHNPSDGCVLAIYPNGSQGVPSPPPGRTVFVTGFQQFVNSVINAGSVLTSTLTGGSSGIPVGALGVIFKAYFTSATVGAFIQIAPHGGTITDYVSIGNTPVANAYVDGNGLVAVDSNGQVDIKANTGNCTVTLYTHGYVI